MSSNSPTEWNAAEYHRVSGPQFGWGLKVLDRVDFTAVERVIDAGCGSGRLTAELLTRWTGGTLLAVDRSANMLRQARAHLAPVFGGRVRFVRVALPAMPVAGWADLIFSTATFHWVLDHPALFANLFAALRPGGRLDAQCGGGANLARAHALAARVMATPDFAPHFAGWRGPWEFATPEVAAARLAAAGFIDIDTSLEEAPTRLPDERSYRDFVTTVNFNSHLDRIPDPDLKRRFIDEIVEMAAVTDPPFCLDYWRLNLRARRPA